jgi:hypothetical protein
MTLVDGLIGMTLVVLGALVFTTAFPVASRARAASEQNAIAIALAQQRVEQIRNMPFEAIEPEYFETPGLQYGYGYTQVQTPPDTSALKQIDVCIHWYMGDLPKEFTLTTYVTNH